MSTASETTQEATRERLVKAARDIFSEKGYHETTVRDICRRARANVAAVNYHFGDKADLYLTVLRQAHCAATTEVAAAVKAAEGLPPKEQLRAFVHGFLSRLLDSDNPHCPAQMMAHEMIAPTPALDAVVQDSIRPLITWLERIIRRIVGENAAERTVIFAVGSVVGQILFHKNCQEVARRLYPQMPYDAAHIAQLAQHITDFSYAALLSLKAPKSKGKS